MASLAAADEGVVTGAAVVAAGGLGGGGSGGSGGAVSTSCRALTRATGGSMCETPPWNRRPSLLWNLEPDEMRDKVRELFLLCDKEDKGFITKRDMQRLEAELPLNPEQLEDVFEKLDCHMQGYLTLAEFTHGLGQYLGLQSLVTKGEQVPQFAEKHLPILTWGDSESDLCQEDELHFSRLMDSLGARNVFGEQDEVRALWTRLRRDEPELLNNFEGFLSRVSLQILQAKQEKATVERVLQKRNGDHDREVQHLYEEMEQQMKSEKEKLSSQDARRLLCRSQELEAELDAKEQEVKNIRTQQEQLERALTELNSEQSETRQQNDRLRQSNEELEERLAQVRRELSDALTLMEQLPAKPSTVASPPVAPRDTQEASSSASVTVQSETSILLKQLDMLRDMNRYLRDEKDSFENCKQGRCTCQSGTKPAAPMGNHAPLVREGSVIGDYLQDSKSPRRSILCRQTAAQNVNQCSEDSSTAAIESQVQVEDDEEEEDDVEYTGGLPGTPRGCPAGKEHQELGCGQMPPDRIFKVVLVGESGVGKSCFIQQLCQKRFLPGICATIGVDYHIKTLTVGDFRIALQLWDTAGQERFRSITKQYFRKADGVLVMYDITNEFTFKSVRNWIISLQEKVEDDVVVFLLGNKTDAVEDEGRLVSTAEGKRLAEEYGAVFYECSARLALNIEEPIAHMARLLTEQEDRHKEKVLHLPEKFSGVRRQSERKNQCCA
ncbi:EF-hand calcium-binding domain-containing protein 4B-like isoform X1 [Lethenteron reissneri]|uniref:EF-hand calcium-binding domain-containing protein 4B-like isoform X1 n=1 Tax=Lethenteron reissneri TaxID=7753 RepID=UPI002AB6D70D|nr:EF-hand calcium-binding domain-containing protein 4B-like isoform X1 [Lethenteron reissneri]XP_061420720.1 EF-hand calcium-binding domain-containing protein 4B-like isoform X1 [Lethenteron reissneri]